MLIPHPLLAPELPIALVDVSNYKLHLSKSQAILDGTSPRIKWSCHRGRNRAFQRPDAPRSLLYQRYQLRYCLARHKVLLCHSNSMASPKE
jgi:hypothetical protein